MGKYFEKILRKHRLSLALCSIGLVSMTWNDMPRGAGCSHLERYHSPGCSVLTCLWQHKVQAAGTSTHLRAPLSHPGSRKLKLSSFPVASQRAAAGPCSRASPRTPVPSPAPGNSPGPLQTKGLRLEQHRNPAAKRPLQAARPAASSPTPSGSCREENQTKANTELKESQNCIIK